MRLSGLCQCNYLIEVDCQLTSIGELCEFGQLLPIRLEVEQVRVHVTCGSHLLKINNGDEPASTAHNVQTSCGCLSTHTVQNIIDALRMSRVDGVGKVGLCIIKKFAGS